LNTIVGGTNLVGKSPLPFLNTNEDPLTVFMALPAKEISSQLTVLSTDLFQLIKAEELFNQAWTKRDKNRNSPQVLAFINHSNSISSWLIRTILSCEQLEKRVEVLKKVVHLAEECFSLNNFDAMVAIMAALDNAAISRLRSAWKV
jgi:son of sevenless-like protein